MPDVKKFVRTGFGQVEPNHLSAQRTSQIYAQLPANKDIKILENGQYVKYDYPNGEVNFTGKGEWMMVFNEIKLYDDWRETYKDYAMQDKNFTPGSDTIEHDGLGPFKGQMVPRVIKTNVGDIYTTNTLVKGNTDGNTEIEIAADEKTFKDDGTVFLSPNAQGYLDICADVEKADMVWQVVKLYTLADMQKAVKIMRIK